MANHVYYNIDIDSSEAGLMVLEDALVTTTKTQLNWEDKEIQVEELAPIHELAFMPKAEKDEHGDPVDSYSWYIDNVGAKWCHIEEWEPMHIGGYSAWSAPFYMAENIAKFIGQTDPNVTLSMTYEDEFRNFIGVANVSYYEGEVHIDTEETDIDELYELMREHYGLEEKDTEADDFDPHEERKDTEGNLSYPNEYVDDLVYEFFAQHRR